MEKPVPQTDGTSSGRAYTVLVLAPVEGEPVPASDGALPDAADALHCLAVLRIQNKVSGKTLFIDPGRIEWAIPLADQP